MNILAKRSSSAFLLHHNKHFAFTLPYLPNNRPRRDGYYTDLCGNGSPERTVY
jgi:hypothetical protein